MGVILTAKQQQALKLIADTPLAKQFYFSGGTALAHYYLGHRKSEDLDFFKTSEFNPQDITVVIKSLQSKLNYQSFDFQNSFNRNLYFLSFKDNYVLKLEFTYYPFEQIEKPEIRDGLMVDSVLDIAVNKIFTIVQKPRGRDYYDLYKIIEKYKFDISDLRMKAKIKFDWDVDVLQLASRFNEVDKHIDDPIIVGEMDRGELLKFFEKEAMKLKKRILQK